MRVKILALAIITVLGLSRTLINRAGQVQEYRNAEIEQLDFDTQFAGSPRGFVYIVAWQSGDVLLQLDTRDLSQPPEVIWRSDLSGWQIIYADPFSIEGDLPPFSEFTLE